jgi:hypothetical protein
MGSIDFIFSPIIEWIFAEPWDGFTWKLLQDKGSKELFFPPRGGLARRFAGRRGVSLQPRSEVFPRAEIGERHAQPSQLRDRQRAYLRLRGAFEIAHALT